MIPSLLISQAVFYSLAFVIVISAILVVTLRNIFHSVLALVVVLFCIAGIYLFLNAEFLALVQILIYVGAIVTLIIFVIMLTARIGSPLIRQTNEQKLIALVASVAILWVLIAILPVVPWHIFTGNTELATITKIGEALMTTYVFPFEIISVVLLVALIGAIILARKETK